MADFAPPSGPPPPKVPEGWKAVWNAQYSEYFYVNLYTKQSQWDKPTEPVNPPGEAPPSGPPPSYPLNTNAQSTTDKNRLSSNNPYASGTTGGQSSQDISEDERLARQLQEEEDARARSHPGGADAYYNQQNAPPQPGYGQGYGQQQQSPYLAQDQGYGQTQSSGKKKGLLGKLLDKASAAKGQSHNRPPQQNPYAAQYGQPANYQQMNMYGRPAGGMGGMMGGGRRPGGGGGMGAGGAAALGVGGGLLGGMMLANAADAGDHGGYGGDGGDYGGDGGGYGGDGGDYGGDGGGDFGGGDFGGGDGGGGGD